MKTKLKHFVRELASNHTHPAPAPRTNNGYTGTIWMTVCKSYSYLWLNVWVCAYNQVRSSSCMRTKFMLYKCSRLYATQCFFFIFGSVVSSTIFFCSSSSSSLLSRQIWRLLYDFFLLLHFWNFVFFLVRSLIKRKNSLIWLSGQMCGADDEREILFFSSSFFSYEKAKMVQKNVHTLTVINRCVAICTYSEYIHINTVPPSLLLLKL